MKYEITMGCGHKETVVLYGPHRERENKIWWYENRGECQACKQARINAENEAAAEQSKEHDWPELKGSEKQKAWATTIRLDEYNKLDTKVPAEYKELFRTCADQFIKEHTDAGWWISYREGNMLGLEIAALMRKKKQEEQK